MVITVGVGEAILIDQSIRITIVAINEDEVQLEVDAPEFVRVDCPAAGNPRGESGRGQGGQ